MKKFLLLTGLFIILPFQINFAAELYVPASEIMSRVNAERKMANVPVLTENEQLTRAARERALDMITRGYLEHVSPDGKSFHIWVDETGYAYSIVGENLASSLDAASAEVILQHWMGSPTHRANILSDKFVHTGIGVVSGTHEGRPAVFVVQIFASPHAAQPQLVDTVVPTAMALPDPVKLPLKDEVKPRVAKLVPTLQGTSSVYVGTTIYASTATTATTTTAIIEEKFASNTAAPERANLWITFVDKVIQLMHAIFG